MSSHDLMEFQKLKDEQIGRLNYRDNLFYLTMVIIGGGLATAFSNPDAITLLLMLPMAVFIAGVAHLTCDRRIVDIGMYVQERLAKYVAEEAHVPPAQVFGWEEYFRTSPTHRIRKQLQLATSLMLYSLSGIGVLVLYWALRLNMPQGPTPIDLAWQGSISALDLAMMVLMAYLIVWFNRAKPQGQRKTSLMRSLFGRVAFAAGSAGLAAGAVLYGMHAVPGPWMTWTSLSTYVTAGAAAFATWSIGLLIAGRR